MMRSVRFTSELLTNLNSLELWEQALDDIPYIERISFDTYAQLLPYIGDKKNIDSYLTSPLYYLFTGRNGLWGFNYQDKRILFCWHPNCDGQILIFSTSDCEEWPVVHKLLELLPPPPLGFKLARVQKDSSLQSLLTRTPDLNDVNFEYKIVEEKILDWAFPVRILHTYEIKNLTGKKFNNVRNCISRIKKFSPEYHIISQSIYDRDIKNLLHRWADKTAETKEEYFNLYECYDSLFSLCRKKGSASGLAFYIDSKLEAVSLWDISNGIHPTANLYANFCNKNYYGLAEFIIVKTCETLASMGIEYLNIGGSETASLDFFKNKFRPVISVDLCSIDIHYRHKAIATERRKRA